MKVLITGGAGFQGSHLAEKWVSGGHSVTVLSTLAKESERNITAIAGEKRPDGSVCEGMNAPVAAWLTGPEPFGSGQPTAPRKMISASLQRS